MKNKASLVAKQILSVLSSIAREKLLGFKSKANALRARLALFSLLKSSRGLSLGAITQKIHALLGKKGIKNDDLLEDVEEEQNKGAIVVYKNNALQPTSEYTQEIMEVVDNGYNACADDDDDDDNKYPDLTHSLFDEEDDEELGDGQGSVIDMVKNSKEYEGEDFCLEDEIDHVADLFIRRFRKQMRLQKLESFKRYQQMLERSV
ncbi:hypothetical protein Ancab_013298 [Ancistrocladus abbreviatus]